MAITKVSPGLLDLDSGITISVTDNSDNLTLTSTDADANSGPNLRMYRNSSSPADSDAIGLIDFEGRNDNSQDVVYATIDTRIVDASDGSEDGRIELATILGGTAGVSKLLMDGTETVFNDNSKDLNFRVESDVSTHSLFVRGSDGLVGINNTAPSTLLHIQYDDSATNSVVNMLTLTALSSGTTTTGFGPGINLQAERNNGVNQNVGFIHSIAEVNSGADISSGLSFGTSLAGVSTETLRLTKDGNALLRGGKTSDEVYMDIFSDSGSNRGAGYFRFLTDGAADEQSVAQIYMEQGAGDGGSRKSNMYFQVSDNGAPATALTIENNKVVTTAGDLVVGADVQMSNGRGIQFNSTTPDGTSVDSETFDDYEEGTWTPANNGTAFSEAYGSYTKIGNRVFCQLDVTQGSGGASSGDWSGLPFTIRNSTTLGRGGGSVAYHNQAAGESYQISTENVNSNTFSIRSGSTQKQLTAGKRLWGSFNYLV